VARAKAKKSSPTLPAPADLERTCKGLAALDAMMSEDWESRYYSFDKAWNKRREERMASMRNGEGDEWFIVFSPAGVFVKAFWHEFEPEDVDAIFDGLPATLAPQLEEPAFWVDEAVTFGGWHDGKRWTLRGNAKPMKDELAMLTGEAKSYRDYASSYFGEQLPLDAIAHVLAGKKLDAKLVGRITKERSLADLANDLAEIGY
jgi:hypothetical protein